MGKSIQETVQKYQQLDEGPKVAAGIGALLKSHGWKKTGESGPGHLHYYKHPNLPGVEITHAKKYSMWYHHNPDQPTPTDPWKARPSAHYGRGTYQLQQHLNRIHNVQNEETEMKKPINEISMDLMKKYHDMSSKADRAMGHGWKNKSGTNQEADRAFKRMRAMHKVHDKIRDNTPLEHEPRIHDMRRMDDGQVYDHTQSHDSVKDGDVMRLSGNRSAIMVKAWPTMHTGTSKHLHHWNDGHSFPPRYAKSVAAAKTITSPGFLKSKSSRLKNESFDLTESSEMIHDKHIKMGEYHINTVRLHKQEGLPWKDHYAASKAHYAAAKCHDDRKDCANEMSAHAYGLTGVAHGHIQPEKVPANPLAEGYKVGDKVNLTNIKATPRYVITGKSKTHYQVSNPDGTPRGAFPKHRIASVNKASWHYRKTGEEPGVNNPQYRTQGSYGRLAKGGGWKQAVESIEDTISKYMTEGRGRPRKDGTQAEDDSADKHIIMQLRKVVSLRSQKPVTFQNGETYGVHAAHAHRALQKYNSMKMADDKERLVHALGHSRNSFFKTMSEECGIELAEAKATHIVHLHKNQRGSWGSTQIGEKKVKIHVPEGGDVDAHAGEQASKLGWKRITNGDSVSWSVHKVEPLK